MRGYRRDEYEDWDEYEEDGDDQEEEVGGVGEHEETHQPTQEELDYLLRRQRIKDAIRRKMKKDSGTGNPGSLDRTKSNSFHNDNYGSFFGPSQPVIAQRVIQESKSLRENPDLAARISKSTHKNNKTTVSAPSRSKSQPNHRPNVTNGYREKVEMLKNTRDYSFLSSEDAEVPASFKSPPSRNVSAPKSDARSAQLQPRVRQVVTDHGREHSNGRDGKKPILASSHSKPKGGPEKLAHNGKSSMESRKQLGSYNGSGPGRPVAPKGMPIKSSIPAGGKVTQPAKKNNIYGDRKPNSSSSQSVARRPTQSNLQSGSHRPTPSYGHPSGLKRPLAQKEYQERSKSKVISKSSLPSSRAQSKRSPTRIPPRAPSRDERPKSKPKRELYDNESDGENAINLIRQMFRYNPNKFRDDDDDSDMEANFDDIMREEKRSAKIARKEDEEQLRLIEEEERRERMRLEKRRKLNH